MVGLCWRTQTRSRPRPQTAAPPTSRGRRSAPLSPSSVGASAEIAIGAHRRHASRAHASASSNASSAALTGDQDAAVSDRPRDGPADPWMAGELAVAIPHGPLERERELVTSRPSLDVDELIALEATERDRSRPSPAASATRERDDRDRRAATLELLPHSLRPASSPRPGRSRAACGWEASRPDGVRHSSPGSALQVGQRRAPPATRDVEASPPDSGGFRDEYRPSRQRTPGAAQQSGHHSIQPCTAVAHRRSRALAPRPWSPFWSPFFWRELTFDGSRWRTPALCAARKSPAPGAI